MRVDLSSLSDYLDTDTPKKGTILQRKLLNALLAALATTALIGALLPLTVLAASENCPAGYDHKSDPPENLTTEWGSATLVSGGSAVSFYVKDGYTVDVCVKGGNEGFDTETIVGENTVVVATPTNQEVSHYEWSFSTTPTTTTTTEGSTTSSSQPTTTSTTTTTTVASSTTSTSSPATTTSTTEPSTTSTIQSSSSTTSSDEVLGSTLPFTGGPSSALPPLALSLLAAGTLIVATTRRAND